VAHVRIELLLQPTVDKLRRCSGPVADAAAH
jgi:hypothetical protein